LALIAGPSSGGERGGGASFRQFRSGKSPVDENRLVTAMLERFAGSFAERMTALLRFLAPDRRTGSITVIIHPQKTLVVSADLAL
jgi:hypothetical protein